MGKQEAEGERRRDSFIPPSKIFSGGLNACNTMVLRGLLK